MRVLILVLFLVLGCFSQSNAQPLMIPCTSVSATTCAKVSASAPLPVTGTFTPSGSSPEFTPVAPATATATNGVLLGAQYDSTQKTLTNGQQAAVSASARGALFVAVGADGFAVTNAGTFAAQVTLPATPLIASGSGVVLTPTTESASAVAPSTAVSAAESCRVLQASASNVYKVTVAIAATTGYVMIFNATSAPVDGAVSPAWPAIRVVSDGTSGWADIPFNPPLRLGTGATVCFSSTGPFTKTASATAAIGGQVK